MMKKLIAVAMVVAAAMPGARAGDPGAGFTTTPCAYPENTALPGSGTVREVGAGQQFSSIQAAVNAAAPGDLVLVHPGTYHETVNVSKDRLRIRGVDRNTVILDGAIPNSSARRNIGISVVGADHVVVENLTVRGYTQHGVFWWHAHGYWGRYLTVHNIRLYGIYAFDSRCGQIDNSYASGNGDAGFYIGECYPCDAVITDIVAEYNALGYSGTNAGGNLILRNSTWRHNAMGIVPNSLDGEEEPPQRDITIINNQVYDNNNKTAPGSGIAGMFWGGGIVIAGGNSNTILGNTVTDHALAGIAIAPIVDELAYIPSGNTVRRNVVSSDPQQWPDSLDLAQGATAGPNNCWSDNTFTTAAPASLQTTHSCRLPATPPGGYAGVEAELLLGFAGFNGRQQYADWANYPEGANGMYPLSFPQAPAALGSWIPAVGT